MRRALALLFALSLPLACSPKLIPGTEIRDNDDNHQILAMLSGYRAALEARNLEAIMVLVSPRFFDDAGTPDGSDDFDYSGLKTKLANWVGKTQAVRATIQVKRIDVKGDVATVRFYYELNYQLKGLEDGSTWKRDSDSKEMTLRRENGRWMISRGI
jgi:ketosteroid isomerase-like protein